MRSQEAEDFAKRFLAAEDAVSPYLPGSSEVVQSLARRLPAEAMAMKSLDLSGLSAEERKLLVKLAQQLYSYMEVRKILAGEPPFGECQEDAARHTRAPE